MSGVQNSVDTLIFDSSTIERLTLESLKPIKMVLNVHLTRPWGDVLEEKIRSYIFSTAVLRHQWIIHWDRIFYFSVTKKEQSSRQLYSRGGALVSSSGFLLFELPDLSQDYFFHS